MGIVGAWVAQIFLESEWVTVGSSDSRDVAENKAQFSKRKHKCRYFRVISRYDYQALNMKAESPAISRVKHKKERGL